MSDVVDSLSSQTGISAEQIHKGLGSVLKMLEDQLPPELFSKVKAALPDAHAMMSAAESKGAETAGGMVQAVKDLAGRLFGTSGEAATDLFTRLGEHGFSADQLKAFVPKVLEHFKGVLPPEALEKLEHLVPGLSGVAESGNP
jgi:hypothetical protein